MATRTRFIAIEQAFHDNAIDIEILSDITDDDLVAMGVKALGHRKKLLRAISAVSVAGGRPTGGQFPHLLGTSDHDSERRQITVLFADLVDSTGLAARLDPEDLRDVLRGYHNCCATLVQRFDGSVAQFQGDGIIAHFGYPRAHEDDARRAVRCGLSITDEVAQLQLPRGVNLAARVGIATGLVVVGDLIGTEQTLERAAVGSVPNIASRLQNLAGPSSVVIESTTHRLVEDNFALQALGKHEIKGIEQPTHVWQVLSGEPSKSLEASRVAFVGRRSELQQCRNIITECRDAARGQLIYVRGEPGIGKTRFIEEVMRAAEPLGFASHRGLLLDFGAGPTQDPIRSIVRSLLRIERGDDLDSQRSTVNSIMASASLAADDRVFLEDLLGLPLSTSERSIYDAMDNDSRNRRKREALTAIVEQSTHQRACLVILEDLHWATASILGYAAALVGGIRNRPALLIMTSRLDGDPVDAGWRATIGAPFP